MGGKKMQMKYANAFKLEVYQSELLEKQRKIEQAFFYYPRKEKIPNYVISYEEAIQLHEWYSMYYQNEYACAKLINHSIRRKGRGVKMWALEQLGLVGELYFATINFNDKTYKQSSLSELKKIARNYFDSLECSYCYCLGVGDKNQRIHYHAITTKKPQIKETAFGYVYYKKIANVSEMDKELIMEYLNQNKLSLERERLMFTNAGQFIVQISRYIAHNSYYASLVLNKQQRIIFVDRAK